jgi:hypothetical protein
MRQRLTDDCIKICTALGYDINTVEFAVRDGIPYAIDFMNPAPDGERNSIGDENFEWFVENVASFAIKEAMKGKQKMEELVWHRFLAGPTDGNGSNMVGNDGSAAKKRPAKKTAR